MGQKLWGALACIPTPAGDPFTFSPCLGPGLPLSVWAACSACWSLTPIPFPEIFPRASNSFASHLSTVPRKSD